MDLTNEWYFYKQALDKTTCNKIVKLANKKFSLAEINDPPESNPENTRVSDIVWVKEQWLYNLIWPYMEDANKKADWGFDIVAAEAMQLTRYKKGQFYNFHKDGGSRQGLDNNKNIRKLSMSIILNNKYDGGQFQFAILNPDGEAIIHTPENQDTGYIIIFPSFMIHRVKQIIRGIRYSLVAWFVGPPFK